MNWKLNRIATLTNAAALFFLILLFSSALVAVDLPAVHSPLGQSTLETISLCTLSPYGRVWG